MLLDDEVRVALLRGAALDSGQWVRGGPQSPSSQTPPPVDKEDRERGGGGWGGSRSSSPSPALSSGAAETSQPSQRLVLGCVNEPLVGEEREVLRGGLRRWLPSLQGVRLSSSNPIAFVSHFATPAPHFASFVAHSVPTPAVAQLAWLVHGPPKRAVSTVTAASSSFIKEAVALSDRLTVQPREVWRPTINGNEIHPTLTDWVPAATTSAVSVTAERRLTTTMDESLLLSACQDWTECGALEFTSTSAAIAVAAAAAAAVALTTGKTPIAARRGGRSGAVAVLLGGGGVSLALFTGGAAYGLAS